MVLLKVAVLGLLGLSGCGGDDSGSRASGQKSALDGLSATEVRATSRDAVKAATSVSLAGESVDGEDTIKLDVVLTSSGRGSGTIAYNDAQFEVLVIGKDVYLKADERTWGTIGASPNPRFATEIGDKYAKAPADNPRFASLVRVFRLRDFVDGILNSGGPHSRVKGKDIDGIPTVALRSSADGSVLSIADRGTPYPLLLEGPNGEALVTFKDWDKAVTIDPPPADQVLDFGELAK